MPLRHFLSLGMALSLAAASVQAQSTTWNLANPATGGAPQDNRCVISAAATQGNSAVCNANDPSEAILTVRGYAFSNWSGSTASITVSRAALNNQGSSGLGLCNGSEGWSCSGAPSHSIDNANTFTDFVLLQTASSMVLNSVRFGWAGDDADFTVLRYSGAADPLIALNGGQTMQSMFANGWSVVTSVNGTSTDGATYSNVNPSNLSSTHWIIAARNPALHDGASSWGTDAFKINQVTGTIVPEPSTGALLATGVLTLVGAMRRRRTV